MIYVRIISQNHISEVESFHSVHLSFTSTEGPKVPVYFINLIFVVYYWPLIVLADVV